jgi:cytochrome c
MESLEFNKVAGAILGALLFTVATGILADAIFAVPRPGKPGYALPFAKAGGSSGKAANSAASVPLANLLAKADPKKGHADTKPCQVCHNFEKGAGPKIGPPLYGVVGRKKGSIPGFAYSAGMKSKGGIWTFADINTFITNPSAYVPGTKMTFSGEPEATKRADIIAYLRTLSDNPVPLPKPVPVKAPAKAAAPAPAKAAAPGNAAKPPAAPAAAPAAPAKAASPAPAKAAAPAPAPAAPAPDKAPAPSAAPATAPAAPAPDKATAPK